MIVNDMAKAVLGSTELVAASRKLLSLGWKVQVPIEDGFPRPIYWFKYTDPIVAN